MLYEMTRTKERNNNQNFFCSNVTWMQSDETNDKKKEDPEQTNV